MTTILAIDPGSAQSAWLKYDGTRLYEATVTPRDWIAFRACLVLHAWAKEKAA